MIDFQPLDNPPPIRDEASNTKVLEDGTTSFVEELPIQELNQKEQPSDEEQPFRVEQPIYYEVPVKHPIQAVISTVGAVVMIFLMVLGWRSIPVPARTIARGIGVSCALTGLIWCFLSLKTKYKIFWIVLGYIANLILIILSLL
jgi:hypothetical protein